MTMPTEADQEIERKDSFITRAAVNVKRPL